MMNMEKWQQEKAVVQELRSSPESQARNIQALRAAWLAGDKKNAIQLYRSFCIVDAKTAQAALEAMESDDPASWIAHGHCSSGSHLTDVCRCLTIEYSMT